MTPEIALATEPENTEYTFDTFVVSKNSRLAFSVSQAIVESAEQPRNPLLLYGPTGSGKSHLLHAIAHAIRSHRPKAKILRVAADTFVTHLVDSIRFDRMRAFEHSLTDIDVLLLDDISSVFSKKRTMKEIFRIVRALVSRSAQVVVTSNRSRRMCSQFEGAFIAELGYPSGAARVEIARRAAAMRGLSLSEARLRYLAGRTSGSAPELRSVIARIAAEATFSRT